MRERAEHILQDAVHGRGGRVVGGQCVGDGLADVVDVSDLGDGGGDGGEVEEDAGAEVDAAEDRDAKKELRAEGGGDGEGDVLNRGGEGEGCDL